MSTNATTPFGFELIRFSVIQNDLLYLISNDITLILMSTKNTAFLRRFQWFWCLKIQNFLLFIAFKMCYNEQTEMGGTNDRSE